jgi:lysozyme family protein
VSGFLRALPFVLRVEGGLSDHAADRGGKTKHGITQATYDAWREGTGQTKRSVSEVTAEEVQAIYHKEYWLAARCDSLPWPLSLAHFDASVNHGPETAWRIMQRALGVKDDGQPGPVTMQAAYAANVESLTWRWLKERAAFYANIVKAKPGQAVFLKGWLNRLFDLHREMRA